MVSTYQKNPRFFPPGSAVFPRVLSRGKLEKLWKTLARMEPFDAVVSNSAVAPQTPRLLN